MHVAVIGAGGIGSALVECYRLRSDIEHIHVFSRGVSVQVSDTLSQYPLDLCSEASIEQASSQVRHPLSQVIVATGLLHDEQMLPEKSISQLTMEHFQKLLAVNTVGPALVAKHFLPKLTKDNAVFSMLSARVGSISDNRLGGWYSYRASKAALNMIIKSLAIEYARKLPKACIVGLHPGTVDTRLSKPFQKNVPAKQLFSNEQSAQYLLKVIAGLSPKDSGKCFAWDGQEVPA